MKSLTIPLILVGCTNNGTGIMFLNEVALGNEKHINMDDSSLRAAPKGFDSIVAKGRTEPGKLFWHNYSQLPAGGAREMGIDNRYSREGERNVRECHGWA